MTRAPWWLALALVAGPALATGVVPSSPARIRAIAALPDWTGVWQAEGNVATLAPFGPPPPYTPAWAAKVADMRAQLAHLVDPRVRLCTFGFPRMLGTPRKFEMLVTPEETLVHLDQREIRHLWTDGRAHPSARQMWPTEWGDSVAHWNGQTLAVDTVMARPDLWIDATGAILSGNARFSERWTMQDNAHLQDAVAITDPVALTATWSFNRSYRKLKDRWLVEDECGWTAGTANRKTR